MITNDSTFATIFFQTILWSVDKAFRVALR